jgi:hypothetical protein
MFVDVCPQKFESGLCQNCYARAESISKRAPSTKPAISPTFESYSWGLAATDDCREPWR